MSCWLCLDWSYVCILLNARFAKTGITNFSAHTLSSVSVSLPTEYRWYKSMCTNVELSTCSCTRTLYIAHVMKNARRRWNAISRAQAIAGWWGPIGILSVPNLTLAQLKDSGHIWHHILQKYSNSYWKLAFGSSWISALVVYFQPILCNKQKGCTLYNVQLSSLNCTLLTWLGIPQCVTLISHLVWLASSRAFREGTCQLAGLGLLSLWL